MKKRIQKVLAIFLCLQLLCGVFPIPGHDHDDHADAGLLVTTARAWEVVSNCEFCGDFIADDYICDCGEGGDHCSAASGRGCYDDNHCGECGAGVGQDKLCSECGEICEDCASRWCSSCNTCDDCATICGNCEDTCSNCGYVCWNCSSSCEKCSEGEKCPGCEICYDCYVDNGYCQECGQCSDCVTLCEDCGEICSECDPEFNDDEQICSACSGPACTECGTYGAETYCEGCGRCDACAVICICGKTCEECGQVCPDCAEHCEDCYHYATASYLNSFTWTSGTGADADAVLQSALTNSGLSEMDAATVENVKWMMTYLNDCKESNVGQLFMAVQTYVWENQSYKGEPGGDGDAGGYANADTYELYLSLIDSLLAKKAAEDAEFQRQIEEYKAQGIAAAIVEDESARWAVYAISSNRKNQSFFNYYGPRKLATQDNEGEASHEK